MGRTSVLMLGLLLIVSTSTASSSVMTPDLAGRVAALAPDAEVPVIVHFADHVDLRGYTAGRAGAPGLIMALEATAASSQAGALALLQSRGLGDRARVLWINNSLALPATASLLDDLARMPGVESIEYDEPVVMADETPDAVSSVYWNLSMVHVPDVWSLYGLDGTGIVIGSIDTGADITHLALQGKWRGGTNSWKDFVNNLPTPYDDHGHGTHTIGTMVGGDGPGPFTDDIGIAYGAKFISAKVMDATSSFSSASIVISGAQWMLNPDGNAATNDFPQVINNSWLFSNAVYAGFYTTVQAWRAAGIIPVCAIGNFGPGSSTTHPPGSYNNVIGVGATDAADVIASYSSRGPAPNGTAFPTDDRKPDLCAPGSAVTSSLPGGSYAAWSGTSMATPHVAGTVALMLQAHPGFTYDQVKSLLFSSSVDLGTAGYDFAYGYGRLDALGAVAGALVGVGPARLAGPLDLQVRPNPSHGPVAIEFTAAAGKPVAIDVFDPSGRRVWSARPEGTAGAARWDGRDEGGRDAPPGLYLVRVTDGAHTRVGRLARLR